MTDTPKRLARLARQLTGDSQTVTVSPATLASGGTDNQVLTRTATGMAWEDMTDVSFTLTVEDEGTALTTGATRLNFTGAGVTASGTNQEKTINIPGGGGTSLPSEHASLGLTITTTEQITTSNNLTITGTITVNSPYTFAGTGSTNGTGGTETLASSNTTAFPITNKDSVTDNTFTIVVPAAQRATVQSGTITATVFATLNSITYHQTVSETIRIVAPIPHYYTSVATSVPANNAAMTDSGNFASGVRHTFTATAGGTGLAYVALPTRTNGYTFKSGELFLTTTTISTGYSQTGYTLYRMDDFVNGTAGTLIVTIEEA